MRKLVVDKKFNINNVKQYAFKLAEDKLNKKLSNGEILSKKILKKYEKDRSFKS